MFLQNYLLGLILSTLYGSLFHLWRGGNFMRLLFYWALSGVGFWIGHWAGDLIHLGFGKVGPLQVASATLGSTLCLFIGHWLSLIRIRSPEERLD